MVLAIVLCCIGPMNDHGICFWAKSMTNDSDRKAIELVFEGDDFADGNAPIGVIADKLRALQDLFYHAAATVHGDATMRRGPWANKYRGCVELTLHTTHYSSLTIEAWLPTGEHDLLRMGKEATNLLLRVASSAARGDTEVNRLVPERQARGFLLRGLERLCPSEGEDYRVSLSNGSPSSARVVLTGQVRERVRRLVAPAVALPEPRTVTLVGQLVKIHVEVGPAMIAIQRDGQEIKCYYDETLRDQIENLLPGSTVEVTGSATLDTQGAVTQINSIGDIDLANMEPLRMRRFEYGANTYRLRKPLIVEVQHSDGLWVYRNSDIGLWGVGERRVDALKDLNENFDFLYEEYAKENDSRLDSKALQLKMELLNMVERGE